MSGGGRRRLVLALVLGAVVACGEAEPRAIPPASDPERTREGPAVPPAIVGQPEPPLVTTSLSLPSSTRPSPPRPAVTAGRAPAAPAMTAAPPGSPVEVAYRLERRTGDPATAGFEAMAEATLADPRGWGRSGFRLVRRASAPFVVVLAEGPEVDALCLPYETYATYSCQNGPVVALNADRWRTATPKWTGTLEDYRRYLVGHEVGHLLGLRHPRPQCPAPGQPAPLMAQQSTELDGCLPNPWPLAAEVEEGRRRPPDLAPPYRR